MYKYNIILSNSDQNKDKELQLINTMLEKQVDGIIFMGGNISEEHVQQFSTASVPVVLAATYDGTDSIPSVNIDYEEAAYEATNHLISKGNEKVAFIYGKEEYTINQLKNQGYLRALKEANLPIVEDYIVSGDYTYESGMENVEKFMSLPDKPTAVFAASDAIALGVIHGAQDLGYRVPEDLEVFGFDNTKLATMVRPTLS